jgi:hypothetical protein
MFFAERWLTKLAEFGQLLTDFRSQNSTNYKIILAGMRKLIKGVLFAIDVSSIPYF